MKFAFRKLPLMALGLALMAIAQPASAGYSESMMYPGGAPGFTDILSFAKYDPALAGGQTLIGVQITVTETGTVFASAFNSSGTTQTVSNVTATENVTVTGPDATTTSASITSDPWSAMIGPGFTQGPTTNGFGSSTTSAANISDYEGGGPASITISTVGSSLTYGGSASGQGTVFIGGSSSVSGLVTITFITAPAVPEPASLGMVVLGLGGIYAVRRFRRKVA